MTIQAKFSSTCTRCHGPIEAGERIEWERGAGASHLDCEPAPVPEPTGDLKRAVDFLLAQDAGSEFYDSLRLQYRQKGSLSPRQIAAVVRNLDAARLPGPDVVPAGRYAVDIDGETRLIRVWRGSRNPSYVCCYDGEGDDEMPLMQTIEAIVAVGPADAAIRYGRLTHKCSRCNADLTNALSAYLNIGPVCIKHWFDDDTCKAKRAEGRRWLRAHNFDPSADLPRGVDLAGAEARLGDVKEGEREDGRWKVVSTS